MLFPLFRCPTFSLHHDSDNNWLYAQWTGRQDSTTSLAACAIILQHVHEVPVSKLLCDSSQALDGWSEISTWVANNYLPRLADLGVCVISWINATDWSTNDTITSFVEHSDKPFIATFNEGATAYEWLRNTHFICS
ncbi:hypothetical protein [Hymenobacter crusticola]|uniref:STAS/SEC14 domain-containing protein n=1 Tax=Hymenobacter crusticola TaxID=1770526 RepID=A0A243W6K0_9BACT|nr:hypothetical protein [Hymenobacter crusticola]OUJ70040.1 hypothetical protein BXP70_25550 [Hymenobacter crusticola]